MLCLSALALPIAGCEVGATTRHVLGSLADVPAAFASGVLLCELADRRRGGRGTRVVQRDANARTPGPHARAVAARGRLQACIGLGDRPVRSGASPAPLQVRVAAASTPAARYLNFDAALARHATRAPASHRCIVHDVTTAVGRRRGLAACSERRA